MPAAILSFADHLAPQLHRESPPPSNPRERLTLRAYYDAHVRTLPEIADQSAAALAEDRYALNNWERYTANPPLADIGRDHLQALRDGMERAGRSPATINKTWRELAAILRLAVDADDLAKCPTIGPRSKSRLIREAPKMQRDILTAADLATLHAAARFATYPDPAHYPTARIWRAVLLFLWLYGPRRDDLFKLRWDSIQTRTRLVKFVAMKTRKIQGLPLTDLALEHLAALREVDATYVFGPLWRTAGAYNRTTGRWSRGFYTTWKTEILTASDVVTTDAHKSHGTTFRHFREAMITHHNGIEAGLGAWIAGHYQGGVTAKSYEFPTQRIRDAIERVDVPRCFSTI